ncbi:unnamed protein product [Clavelina lepadiformis]|uniref:DUF3504 domain-containing protein n=1 Tax=Clavelina lepadiformis TaxID=159417 RepID=A0ABP0F2S5_CLALP
MHGHGACRSLLRADGILGKVANESQSLTEQGTVLLAKQNHENKGELVENFVTFEKQSDVCNFTKPFEFAVCGEGKNEETREKDGIYHDDKKFVKTTLDQNLELSSIENPFEMAKINCQGPVESYFGSFENNQPQELNLYESGKTFPINADDLFGESVFENIEEFIYDQNSFTAAANNSFQLPQPGQNDALSFQYMTNETQSDDTAGILSNNFNDISLVKDKADYFFETGPPLRTASPSPEREKYQRLYSNDFASNVQLEIREKHRTFRSVDSKRSNSSEKLDDPRLAVSRKRDYSLSNDSGVGGCVTLESTRSISPRYAGKSLLYDCSAPGIVTNFSSGALIYSNQCLEFSNVSALSSQATRSNATARHGSYNNNKSDNNLNSTHDEHVNPPLTSSLSPKPDIDFTLKKDGDVRSENRETDSCEEVDLNKGGELNPSMHFASSQVTLDGKNSSKKTAYNEKWGVKVLKAWCVDNKVATDVENLNAEQLNTLLGQFWTDVRKTNGDYYGRNSLFNLRAMINKHLKGKPYCATFDIVTDERFRTSNERLEKQLKILKGIGRTITHKQPISINDLRKMYDSNVLGTSNPLALLRKVWFEITLHFCHKGSESQEKLKKTSFKIYGDNSGKRFVGRSFHNNSEGNQVRMYETGGILCPVKSFELYNRKLHALQPRLFQQPRRKSTVDSPMWYGKAPIGEKALQQMMANISSRQNMSSFFPYVKCNRNC